MSDHCCGARGFADSGDTCPGCQPMSDTPKCTCTEDSPPCAACSDASHDTTERCPNVRDAFRPTRAQAEAMADALLDGIIFDVHLQYAPLLAAVREWQEARKALTSYRMLEAWSYPELQAKLRLAEQTLFSLPLPEVTP